MEIYIICKIDWINFVNGKRIKAQTNETKDYYKKILVSMIEVLSCEGNSVTIEKKY